MLTLFSTIFSFLTGGLPKLLDFFQDRNDKKHELAMAEVQFKQQLELQKAGYQAQKELEEVKLEEIELQTMVQERQAMYQHDSEIGKGASRRVVNLRAIVRPVITFGLFAIFLFVELFGCYYAVRHGTDFQIALKMLWSHDTQTIWASIVAFWFGTQAFSKR
jgi:hypothetical protein